RREIPKETTHCRRHVRSLCRNSHLLPPVLRHWIKSTHITSCTVPLGRTQSMFKVFNHQKLSLPTFMLLASAQTLFRHHSMHFPLKTHMLLWTSLLAMAMPLLKRTPSA